MSDKTKKWLIAAGILILVGALITAAATGLGAREVSGNGLFQKFRINVGNGTPFEVAFTSDNSGDTKQETVTFTKEQTDAVTGMEIEWNAGTIQVEPWDKDYIEAYSEYESSAKAPSFELRGDKLCISSELGAAKVSIGISTDMNIKTAIVYVPEGKTFDSLMAEMNAGIMDVRDIEIEEELEVELNAGQLTLKNIVSPKETKVKVNAGDLRVKDAKFAGRTDIEVNAGKADFDGEIKGAVAADVAAGLLEIDNSVSLSETGLKVNVSAGAAEVNGHAIAGFAGDYTDQKAGAPNSFTADVMAGALKVKYAE